MNNYFPFVFLSITNSAYEHIQQVRASNMKCTTEREYTMRHHAMQLQSVSGIGFK